MQAQTPLLCSLPGAGVLIFWQLGVLSGLQQRYDMRKVPCLGSSSGAVACSIFKSGADLQVAAQRGAELVQEHGVMHRRLGWVGILSRLTRQWLEDTLPHDADRQCSGGAASLLVTTLPFLRNYVITDYNSRDDLIHCVLASSHIPLARPATGLGVCADGSTHHQVPDAVRVCDMRLWVSCRWRPCLDGGLWWLLQRSEQEYRPRHARHTLLISPFHDPHVIKDLHILRRLRPSDFSAMQSLMGMGMNHAAVLADQHREHLLPYTLPTGCTRHRVLAHH